MALEVTYVCMKDESDRDIPKIFRVIKDGATIISYSPCRFEEVAKADPSKIEEYFDLLREHLRTFATYIDAQTTFNLSVYRKMIDMNETFVYYFTNCPIDYNDETGEAIYS